MDLDQCEAETQIFPGDGYSDRSFGTNGHGPDLAYTDNGDLTATDNLTKFVWELKLPENDPACAGAQETRSVHCVHNTYEWSNTPPAADGTMFTEFLDILNNRCDGDESTQCTTDAECTGIGNGLCGQAGHRDWEIPNIKKLLSVVDYSVFPGPATSLPGATAEWDYASTTTYVLVPQLVWVVFFNEGSGIVTDGSKSNPLAARAVRAGSD